jgi:hypothetical protein
VRRHAGALLTLATTLLGCRAHETASALLPTAVSEFRESFHTPSRDSVRFVTELRATPEAIVGTVTSFWGDSLIQQVVGTFEANTARLTAVSESTTWRVDALTYEIGRLRGRVAVRNLRGTLDTFSVSQGLPGPMLDRRTLFIQARWMPLEPGRSHQFSLFDPDVRTVYPLQATVAPAEPITVPAGTFTAHRLELTTDPPEWFAPLSRYFPLVLWIRADSTRRLLRVERPVHQLVLELDEETS